MSKGPGKVQRFIVATVCREPYRAWPLPALAQLYAEHNNIRPPGSDEAHYTDSLIRSFRRAHVRLPEISRTHCAVDVPGVANYWGGPARPLRAVTVLYARAWDIDPDSARFRMSARETQHDHYWHDRNPTATLRRDLGTDVARLRERLETERDDRTRRAIEAQLTYLSRGLRAHL